MKTDRLGAFRLLLSNTILHGTVLLEDLQTLNDNFSALLPMLGNLSERERASHVAVLCGYNPELPADLHQLVESLTDVLAGLTAADSGKAWLRRQMDTLQTPGESAA